MTKVTKPKQNLTQRIVTSLRDKIESGSLKPGDKLPTEHQLIAEFGVSRTVVREAISALKADKLLDSRQGAGVFVLPPSTAQSRSGFPVEKLKTIADVIESLELRTAVEVGSAELAALRCSPAQEATLIDKFAEFKKKVEAGELSEKEDFAFHLAIAEAANNKRFTDFLTLLGKASIPRSELRHKANLPQNPEVEQEILSEHETILQAICDRNPEEAGRAMRHHLMRGAQRYRNLGRKVRMM